MNNICKRKDAILEIFVGITSSVQNCNTDSFAGQFARKFPMNLNSCLIHEINIPVTFCCITIRVFRRRERIAFLKIKNFFIIYLNIVHTFFRRLCYTYIIRNALKLSLILF